jgi:hypothetical protein
MHPEGFLLFGGPHDSRSFDVNLQLIVHPLRETSLVKVQPPKAADSRIFRETLILTVIIWSDG